MKIKQGDTVKVLIGQDKGKTAKVLKVLYSSKSKDKNKVIVEGLNLRYKHVRPKKSGEKGQRIMFPMFPFAMNISNVALVCPKCDKTTRVSYKVLATASETTREKRQRLCKKCQAVI
jgi:large subunit ribosomal protein L24